MSTDLVIYRGDDRDFPITLTEEGTPFNLTGFTIVFSAREAIDSPQVVFSLTSEDDGITIANQISSPGQATIHVPADATSGMLRGLTLVCDLELTDGDGNVRTAPEPAWSHPTLIRLRVRDDITHV